jgi:hypothetical protein
MNDLHLKVRGVALWIKTLQARGESARVVDAAFETLMLAADALGSAEQQTAGYIKNKQPQKGKATR